MTDSNSSLSNEQMALIHAWLLRAANAQEAHYASAVALQRRHRVLGIPIVIFSALVGAAGFASLAVYVPDIAFKMTVGILGTTAAVLSGLQSFLAYSDRAEKHKVAAANFGELKRILEVERAQPTKSFNSRAEDVRSIFDRLAQSSPVLFISPRRLGKRSVLLPEGQVHLTPTVQKITGNSDAQPQRSSGTRQKRGKAHSVGRQ